MIRSLSFLQISDIHLDSELARSSLQYPETVVKKISEHQRETLRAALEEGVRRGVGAVLIPGDLWDGESVRQDTIFWLMDLFRSIRPIPVYLLPGNHDPYHLHSPYHPNYSELRRVEGWSDNVFVFRSEECECFVHPERPDIRFYGMATIPLSARSRRLLATAIPHNNEGISILLFHGARDADGRYLSETNEASPFSDEELIRQDFTYVALGHYHQHAKICSAEGRIHAAYSGVPCGRTLSEAGKTSVIFGQCAKSGVGKLQLETVSLAPHSIHRLEVDCTRLTHKSAVLDKIEATVRAANPAEKDIVDIVLTGVYGSWELPDVTAADFSLPVLHLSITQQMKPGYDLEGYSHDTGIETIEKQFVKEMQKRISAATAETERKELEAALYYGLDALVQGRCETIYARYFHG